MSDLTDPAAAAAAAADPGTSAIDLSTIAQHFPELRAQVAMHPAAYPGLLDWLAQLGDPMLASVVAVRRDADAKAAAQAQSVSPAGAAVGQPGPVPFSQIVPTGAAEGDPGQAAPIGQPAAPARGRKRLLIGLAAGVVVVALVAGFATRGFGLLNPGGAATPAEEATKVADKTVRLFNSFSVKNLLSNPISAIGELNDEIAPSESRLQSNFTKVDNSDLFALSSDSVNLAADFFGAFKVKADGLKTEITEITDDVAEVGFVDGEVTLTADTDRLKATLAKFPAVAAAQAETTLARYGLKPEKSIDLNLPDGWSDEFLTFVQDNFPYRVDLADCAAWRTSGQSGSDPALSSICPMVGRIVVVKEAGKWYLSPMLSWSTGSLGGISAYTGVGAPSQLNDPQRQKMLKVKAAVNRDPLDAPNALMSALSKGDEATTLSELPLAERRYAAATGMLSAANLSGYDNEYNFTEIARNGNQTKLRVDQLKFGDGSNSFELKDGTCINFPGTSGCLTDLKDSGTIENAFSWLRGQDWSAFEESTGVNSGLVISKLEGATKAAVKALDPSQIGVVAVQEDGSWLMSFTATSSELQNQLAAAVRVGLLSIQE